LDCRCKASVEFSSCRELCAWAAQRSCRPHRYQEVCCRKSCTTLPYIISLKLDRQCCEFVILLYGYDSRKRKEKLLSLISSSDVMNPLDPVPFVSLLGWCLVNCTYPLHVSGLEKYFVQKSINLPPSSTHGAAKLFFDFVSLLPKGVRLKA
jgi:hypothetical protein